MPLTPKGEEIKKAMTKQYGTEKGEKVFYASKNKGTITGVESGGAMDTGSLTNIREREIARLKRLRRK